jgi:hypothetical protein
MDRFTGASTPLSSQGLSHAEGKLAADPTALWALLSVETVGRPDVNLGMMGPKATSALHAFRASAVISTTGPPDAQTLAALKTKLG